MRNWYIYTVCADVTCHCMLLHKLPDDIDIRTDSADAAIFTPLLPFPGQLHHQGACV